MEPKPYMLRSNRFIIGVRSYTIMETGETLWKVVVCSLYDELKLLQSQDWQEERKTGGITRKTGVHEDNWMHRAKLEATHLSLPSVLKTHMTCRRSHHRSAHILAQDSEKLKEENSWLEIPIGKFLAYPSFDSALRSSVHIHRKGLSTYNTCHLAHSHTV